MLGAASRFAAAAVAASSHVRTRLLIITAAPRFQEGAYAYQRVNSQAWHKQA